MRSFGKKEAARLRAVPPLTPEQEAVPEPARLEFFSRHPDGTWASGGYAQWEGTLYDAYAIGADVWIEYRDTGSAPPGWETSQGSFNARSGRSTFRRAVPKDEIERYVDVVTTGRWRGFEFSLERSREDGAVAIRGGGEALADLIEAGDAPGLETRDRGRSVTGVLPWAEISDVRQEMEELPLPW